MVLFVALLLLGQASPSTSCDTLADCRQQAQAAGAAGDYETFHDLAWRTVQKGRPNDPELMYMLARAQSLSGRPGDALVMLGRLVDMGVAVDATTDDFRRVRALKGWPDLEAKIAGRAAPVAATPVTPATPAVDKTATSASSARVAPPAAAPKTPDAAPNPPDTSPDSSPDSSEEALTFELPPFDAVGLAYDAVSRRFIVGDRAAGRLMVIDEMSHHVTNLVSAASAGFDATITAFEIDARRGDLWVASASADGRQRALHKLQLVSGRVLEEIRQPVSEDPAALTDLAIAGDGTVLALEGTTGRIVRLRPKGRAFEDVCRLDVVPARSLTLADDRVAYVSSDDGLAHVDLTTCASTPVHAGRTIDLSRLDRVRWQNGALVLMQRVADGRMRMATARLDAAGKRIARLQVLAMAEAADPRTSTIAGSDVYYLVAASRPSIRRARVK